MLHCFDIDGTLIRSFMRETRQAQDYGIVEALPGRFERLERLALVPGSRFALVTNQGGVAFGYQTTEQVWAKLGLVVATFNAFFTRPFSVHVAFGHPKAKVEAYRVAARDEFDYRKPGGGMLIEAMVRHRADTATTVFVGDLDTDEQAARAAGVRYYDAEEFFDGH